MKNLFVVLVLLTTANASAFAQTQNSAGSADELKEAVDCAEGSDAGYRISITTGGYGGLTLANVYSESLGNPVLLGTVIVTETVSASNRTYKGSGFKLNIPLESMAVTPNHPGSSLLTRKPFAKKINTTLTCTINE